MVHHVVYCYRRNDVCKDFGVCAQNKVSSMYSAVRTSMSQSELWIREAIIDQNISMGRMF